MHYYALLALAALPAALASPLSPRTDNRRHFYTTNPGGEMAKQGGYTNGGITAYAFTSQVSGTVPMCSSSSPLLCLHYLYTIHLSSSYLHTNL